MAQNSDLHQKWNQLDWRHFSIANEIYRQGLEWNPQGRRARGRLKATWKRKLESKIQNSRHSWKKVTFIAKESWSLEKSRKRRLAENRQSYIISSPPIYRILYLCDTPLRSLLLRLFFSISSHAECSIIVTSIFKLAPPHSEKCIALFGRGSK